MVGLQGLHKNDALRCSNVSTSVQLKSFCPWCLKLGGTLKWLLFTLERCLIGWQLCATYDSHLPAWIHRASWTTVLDVKQVQQGTCGTGGTGKGKKVTQEELQVPGMKGGILITQLRGQQGVIKSGTLLNTFCLVQLENGSWFTSWIFLDPGFIVQANPHSVRQTVISFCSHNICNVMVLTLTILSYVSFALMFQL